MPSMCGWTRECHDDTKGVWAWVAMWVSVTVWVCAVCNARRP
jgi:hypothetical protein